MTTPTDWFRLAQADLAAPEEAESSEPEPLSPTTPESPPAEDKMSSSWFFRRLLCPPLMSPFGDVLLLLRKDGRHVAYLAKNSQGHLVQRWAQQWPKSADPDAAGEDDVVTSACLLPVVQRKRPVKPGSGSGSGSMWTCAVLGFRSGSVEVWSEGGQRLVRRRFAEAPTPVRAIRFATRESTLDNNKFSLDAVYVPLLQDLIVVHENKLIVLISQSDLMSTLIENRRSLAQVQAAAVKEEEEEEEEPGNNEADSDPTIPLSNLRCRRYWVQDQSCVTDVCYLRSKSPWFDSYVHASVNAQVDQGHLQSLDVLQQFLTVGSGPFLQFNLPFNVQKKDLNELADAVVSTVKTGLMRAATNMFWGAGSKKKDDKKGHETEEERRRNEPEHKLAVYHTFKDPTKRAHLVERSPNGLYVAVLDNQNRVLVLDGLSGTVLQVWKGYHHAQLGWIVASSDPKSIHEGGVKAKVKLKVSCLLAIYLPRRGSLEVWSPERKLRIAEFQVSKRGCLIRPQNAVLDVRFARKSDLMLRTWDASFLDEQGIIHRIVVPVRSIVNLTSSSHDSTLQQRMLALLEGEEEGDLVEKALDLLKSSRTPVGLLSMLVDVAKSHKTSVSTAERIWAGCREHLEQQQQQQQSDPQQESLLDDLARLKKLTDFFALIKSSLDDFAPVKGGDDLQELLDCSEDEAKQLKSILDSLPEGADDNEEREEEEFTLGSFMDCFNLSVDAVNRSLNCSKELVVASDSFEQTSLLRGLCAVSACGQKSPELMGFLKELKMSLPNLLEYVVRASVCLTRTKDILRYLPGLSSLFGDVYHSSSGKPEELGDLLRAVENAVPRCKVGPSLYVVLLQWHHFLAQAANDGCEDAPALAVAADQVYNSIAQVSSFLEVAAACRVLAAKMGHAPSALADLGEASFRSLFHSGNAPLPVALADWLVDLGVSPASLRQANHDVDAGDADQSGVGAFLRVCRLRYPLSASLNTLVPHVVWTYCHRWHSQHSRLELLQGGVNFLEEFKDLPYMASLGLVLWNTFFHGVLLEAVNVTEHRSPQRCRNELDLPEGKLCELLSCLVRLLRVMIDCPADRGARPDSKPFYDDLSPYADHHQRPGRHLLLQHLQAEERRRRQSKTHSNLADLLALEFQFALVSHLIWFCELRRTKPLSLFMSQESNLFFQSREGGGGGGGGAAGFDLLSIRSNRAVSSQRYYFIDDITLRVAQCLRLVPAPYNSPGDVVPAGGAATNFDMAEYRAWHHQLSLLGKMWYLSDYLLERKIFSLYHQGHDSLGEDLLSTSVANKHSVIARLFYLAVMRLSKFLHESADFRRKLLLIRPDLMDRLSEVKDEALGSLTSDVTLDDIASLLQTVCAYYNEIKDELTHEDRNADHLLACECLALCQTFRSKCGD